MLTEEEINEARKQILKTGKIKLSYGGFSGRLGEVELCEIRIRTLRGYDCVMFYDKLGNVYYAKSLSFPADKVERNAK